MQARRRRGPWRRSRPARPTLPRTRPTWALPQRAHMDGRNGRLWDADFVFFRHQEASFVLSLTCRQRAPRRSVRPSVSDTGLPLRLLRAATVAHAFAQASQPTMAAAPATPPMHKPKIMSSILENVGLTPLIRLNKVHYSEGVKCEIRASSPSRALPRALTQACTVAKCEFFNAGGSVKDRIGRRMIEDAEKSGRIKKGDILIEVRLAHSSLANGSSPLRATPALVWPSPQRLRATA